MEPTCVWRAVTLRVAELERSAAYYKKHFALRRLGEVRRGADASVYLESVRETDTQPRTAAEAYAWRESFVLELVRDHEQPTGFVPNNGNVEPHRGFGHVAFNVDDVELFCDGLEAAGVKFQKKPREGRMKGLAFALDPDGYWLEIVERSVKTGQRANLSQSMIRVKSLQRSEAFYRGLGFRPAGRLIFADAKFSLEFLQSMPDADGAPLPEEKDLESAEARQALWGHFMPLLELTYNHGAEEDPAVVMHNGNTAPKGFVGHTMITRDMAAALQRLESLGIAYEKVTPGDEAAVVFADPDGYRVVLAKVDADPAHVFTLHGVRP